MFILKLTMPYIVVDKGFNWGVRCQALLVKTPIHHQTFLRAVEEVAVIFGYFRGRQGSIPKPHLIITQRFGRLIHCNHFFPIYLFESRLTQHLQIGCITCVCRLAGTYSRSNHLAVRVNLHRVSGIIVGSRNVNNFGCLNISVLFSKVEITFQRACSPVLALNLETNCEPTDIIDCC